MAKLTDDEATFLSLLTRVQPTTAYEIAKIYNDSPVSNFGTSKGKIYPLIRRLKARALIISAAVPGDRRGSEHLICTRLGKEALRQWIMTIKAGHLLPEDPLRTMVQSFDLLTVEERFAWIASLKAALTRKIAEIEAYSREVTVPFKDEVHENSLMTVQSRLDWLDLLARSPGIGRK